MQDRVSKAISGRQGGDDFDIMERLLSTWHGSHSSQVGV